MYKVIDPSAILMYTILPGEKPYYLTFVAKVRT